MRLAWSNWRQLEWPQVDGFQCDPPRPVPGDSPSRPALVAADALSVDEARQIIAALAARDDSGATSVRELLERADEIFEGNTDIAEYVLGAPIEWWDLTDLDGAGRWRMRLYGTDCGRLYEPAGPRFVAYVTQGALWCTHDPQLWRALASTQREVRARAPHSQLARVALNGVAWCPRCGRANEVWIDRFDDEVACTACGERFDPLSAARKE